MQLRDVVVKVVIFSMFHDKRIGKICTVLVLFGVVVVCRGVSVLAFMISFHAGEGADGEIGYFRMGKGLLANYFRENLMLEGKKV